MNTIGGDTGPSMSRSLAPEKKLTVKDWAGHSLLKVEDGV